VSASRAASQAARSWAAAWGAVAFLDPGEVLAGHRGEKAVGVALEIGAQARLVAAGARLIPIGAIGALGLAARRLGLGLELLGAARGLRLDPRDLLARQVRGL
jgi:hypothetical protein